MIFVSGFAGRPCARACAALTVLSCSLVCGSLAAEPAPLYKRPTADVEARVNDLLARMTLPEKIAQITAVWGQKRQLLDAHGDVDPAKIARVFPNGIGQFS